MLRALIVLAALILGIVICWVAVAILSLLHVNPADSTVAVIGGAIITGALVPVFSK